MPEEDFHLSSQVHFQAHMPSPAGTGYSFTVKLCGGRGMVLVSGYVRHLADRKS